ncbi:MAG: 30S ribosomal protein S18 [Chlamydiales bacterium]|nr:30S ribosomal protein S18 [Chlamydiales bacterium]
MMPTARRNPSSSTSGSASASDSPFAKKRKSCPFTLMKAETIDYKDVENLRLFITERGKILPRRITGVSHFYQKLLKKAIKRARHMALLPFVAEE